MKLLMDDLPIRQSVGVFNDLQRSKNNQKRSTTELKKRVLVWNKEVLGLAATGINRNSGQLLLQCTNKFLLGTQSNPVNVNSY